MQDKVVEQIYPNNSIRVGTQFVWKYRTQVVTEIIMQVSPFDGKWKTYFGTKDGAGKIEVVCFDAIIGAIEDRSVIILPPQATESAHV